MNRKQRRAASRRTSADRIRELQHSVEVTGVPGVIYGLTDACRDCHGDGEFILLPGRRVVGRVYHDDSCPVLNGVTPWQPVPL